MHTPADRPCKALSGNLPPLTHLYVHVPFCASLCHYCAFYSELSRGDAIARYLEALEKEMALWAPHLRPETIFFGGGTPTILNQNQLERLLARLSALLPTRPVEFTFEANPATLSLDKARLLRSFGVNRLSLGIQSFDETVLQKLGRIHTPAQALRSFETARAAGFDSINLDLMFALPGQDLAEWENTLRQAIALQPEHLSTYCLTLEEDTPFWKRFQDGQLPLNEDQEAEMYQRTWQILQDDGYVHYEISNFARAGAPGPAEAYPYRCRHNLAYWRCEDYLGLGPSAASHRHGKRWTNIASTDEYADRLQRGESPADFEETLDSAAQAGEYVAFGLRVIEGVSLAAFRHRFSRDLETLFQRELQWLQDEQLLERSGDRLRLTSRGRLFADEVAAHFVAPAPARAEPMEAGRIPNEGGRPRRAGRAGSGAA